MFYYSSYHTHNHDHNVHHTHEHREYRAPTDESLKILREMEEKIKQKFINSIHVQDTNIDLKVFVGQDIPNMENIVVMVYSLNGKKHQCEYRHQMTGFDELEEIIKGIKKTLSEDIAMNLLAKVLPDAMNKHASFFKRI